MANYYRSVNFSSSTTNYDLLASDANVRNAIKERMTWTDEQLNKQLEQGITNIDFQIYCSDTAIIINDGIEQALIENAVWSTGGYLKSIKAKSIKIKENGINGIFRFNIL